MKDELINDLSIMLMPHTDMNIQDLKMQIEIILQPYEVTKAHTELTVYQGDINERILKKFLAAKIAAGCSARTVEYYGQTIKQTLETIGKPYADVTADDTRSFQPGMETSPCMSAGIRWRGHIIRAHRTGRVQAARTEFRCSCICRRL